MMDNVTPILEITDGTTKVNLLGRIGYILDSWIPAALPERDGPWSSSPFADGRRPVDLRYDNIVDTFNLRLADHGQDQAIYEARKLRNLLRKARLYWSERQQNQPVWIRARGDTETNLRYALIYASSYPFDDDPYQPPFSNIGQAESLIDDITLEVEHSVWMAQEPGQGTCIELSSLSEYYGVPEFATVLREIQANADDGYASKTTTTFLFGAFFAVIGISNFGSGLEPVLTSLSFTGTAIPAGVRIAKAHIQFSAFSVVSDAPLLARIFGEINSSAAIASRSDLMNRFSRNKTDSSVVWNTHEDWGVLGNPYHTPNFAPVLQEIIDDPSWASPGRITIWFDAKQYDIDTAVDPARLFSTLENAATYDPPELQVSYITTPENYGREATCLDEVYIANKKNKANITHVYRYDASLVSFSANLISAALPFALFPNPVGTGDILYMGSVNSLSDSGPWNNIVFDLAAIVTYTGNPQVIYEYWNGAAWDTLNVGDNTSVQYAGPFTRSGVGSVHFIPPDDWEPNTLNGVLAWWARVRIVLGGGDAMTVPTQQNRDIYSSVRNSVSYTADQVPGDLPMPIKLEIRNRSQTVLGNVWDPRAYTTRLIVSARSDDRGEDFESIINLSDEQNNPKIVISPKIGYAYTFGGLPRNVNAIDVVNSAPTGKALVSTMTSSMPRKTICAVDIYDTLASQYKGRHRAYIRAFQNGGDSGQARFWVRLFNGSSGMPVEYGPFVPIEGIDFQMFDIGTLDILPDFDDDETTDQVTITIELETDAAMVVTFYDLELMPADEFIGDYSSMEEQRGYPDLYWFPGHLERDSRLVIDGITYPKNDRRALIKKYLENDPSIDTTLMRWRSSAVSPPILQPNKAGRLFFLAERFVPASATTPEMWQSPPWLAHSMVIEGVALYRSMRGDQ